MEEKPKDVDLIIPMIPEMELTATKTAEAVGEFMKLDQDKIEEIKMALIEACINAFEHSKSEDGRVGISFDIGTEELTIQITDRGKGFDMGQAREKLEKRRESGESRRGWGLTIMQELMDDVKVESGETGTCITMTKRR
ncbi:MAG: ATP-binding protein [Gemmatimonadetes bacterium]|jgi:serine/threonine-protein kinase RsbW|nr:ATP-binding protein [Gemmatimonadota bacterium]